MRTRWHNLIVAAGIVLGLIFASGFVDPPISADEVPPDVDILIKVKQAGLWEMPMGTELAERSPTPPIRDIGARIAAEHEELDAKTEVAARALNVTLPTQPNTDQQGWMNQIYQADDKDVDRVAVNLLRAAHGKVLPLLAQVKVGTRNPVIRAFTTDAMTYVGRHIGYLESTGLVEFHDLPETTVAPSKNSYLDYFGWGMIAMMSLWWLYRRAYPPTVPRHGK